MRTLQLKNSLSVKVVLYRVLRCLPMLAILVSQALFAQNAQFVRNGVSYDYISPVNLQRNGIADAFRTDIHFRLDNAKLDFTYLDNETSFNNVASVIDSLGISNILYIDLVSQSSPEGPYNRNEWLTEHRAQVVYDSLLFRYTNLEPLVRIRKIAESWENLRYYVLADPLLQEQSKQRVIEVIDGVDDDLDTAKRRMKNSLGADSVVGDIYKYLFETYYPVIRNTGIYIVYLVDIFKPAGFRDVEAMDESIPYIYYPPNELGTQYVKRPLLAVKTNMLYNAFFTPDMGLAPIWNVELELYPKADGRWSFMVEHIFPWMKKDEKHQYLQILNTQLEARRYFKKNNSYSGHYLSAYANVNLYDICFDAEGGSGYQGEGFGGGLGYGYVLPFGKTKRWKAEFFVKAGYYESYYDPYDAGDPYLGKYYYHWFDDPNKFVERNWRLRYFGPTGVGATISYDLIHIKQKIKR